MAILYNNAQGQSSGTTLTTGNSGGGSGDAFSSVAVSATNTRIYSNLTSMHGTQSYEINCTTNATVTILWNVAGDMAGAMQAYCYFTDYPTVTDNAVIYAYDSSGLASISISPTGHFRLNDNNAGTIYQTAAGRVPLNQWIRFDLCLEVGASTSTGRIQGAMSLGDSITPLYNYDSGYTVDTGTTAFTSYRFGKGATGPVMPVFYMDDIKIDTGATSLIPSPTTSVISWLGM